MSTETPASQKVSPKVIAPAIFNGALIVAVAMLGAITPELIGDLGGLGPVIFVGISALGSVLAGYITRDPARR
jgi:hypothetical protein